ncbi:MAG: hypothetical protein QXI50_01170 [Candidatus Caldarchaeum sp.]
MHDNPSQPNRLVAKGDVLSRVLESLRALDYPKDRMVLLFVDEDGAFEFCRDRIKANGHV